MTTKDMKTLLLSNGYLEQKERGLYLTDKAKEIGEGVRVTAKVIFFGMQI
jgi:hypothetical protein